MRGIRQRLTGPSTVEADPIETLFVIIATYIALVLPVGYVLSSISGESFIEITIVLTAISLILVMLLLSMIFDELLTLHDRQREILDEQSGWIEAANSPAVVVHNWSVNDNSVLFRLQNLGNSFVERINLKTEVRILTEDDTVRDVYEGYSPLTKPGVEGFRARFLPIDTEASTTYSTEITVANGEGDNSGHVTVTELLDGLTAETGEMVRAELEFTLHIISPGNDTDAREIWISRVGVFEGKSIEDLVYGSTEKRVEHHITPQSW